MRHLSTNEKVRLCLSKHKSKHGPSDQKFSQQQTESDSIKDELTVLVLIFQRKHFMEENKSIIILLQGIIGVFELIPR